jgi:hypothetical protein
LLLCSKDSSGLAIYSRKGSRKVTNKREDEIGKREIIVVLEIKHAMKCNLIPAENIREVDYFRVDLLPMSEVF